MQETSNTESSNMMKYQDINKNTFLDYVLLNKTETDYRNVKIQSVSTEAESHRNSDISNIQNGNLTSISSSLINHMNANKHFSSAEENTLIALGGCNERTSCHSKSKGKNTLHEYSNTCSGSILEEKKEIQNNILGCPIQEQAQSNRTEDGGHNNMMHAITEGNNNRSKEKIAPDLCLNHESTNFAMNANKVHKNNHVHTPENGNGKINVEGKKASKGKRKGTSEQKKDTSSSGNKETKKDGNRESVFENNVNNHGSTLTTTRVATEETIKGTGTEKKSGSQYIEKNQINNSTGKQGKEASYERKKQNKKSSSKGSKHEKSEKIETQGKDLSQEIIAEHGNKNDRMKYFMNTFTKNELEEKENINELGILKEQADDVIRKGFENNNEISQEFSMYMNGMIPVSKGNGGKTTTNENQKQNAMGFANYMNMKGLIGDFRNMNNASMNELPMKNGNSNEERTTVGNTSSYIDVETSNKANSIAAPMWEKMKVQKYFEPMYDSANYYMNHNNNQKKMNEQQRENKIDELEMKNIEKEQQQQNNYFYNLKNEEMFFMNKDTNEQDYLFDSMHTLNNSLDTSMMVPPNHHSVHNKSTYPFEGMNDLTINSERNSHFYDEKLLSEHSNLFDIFMSYNQNQEKIIDGDMNARRNHRETHMTQSPRYIEQMKNYLQDTEQVQNAFAGNLGKETAEALGVVENRNRAGTIEETTGLEKKSKSGKENEEEEDVLNKIFNSSDYFQQLRSFGNDSVKTSQTMKNNTNYYPPDLSRNEDGVNVSTSNMLMGNEHFPMMPLMGKYDSMKIGTANDGKKGNLHIESSLQETFQLENFTDQSFQDSFFQDLSFGEKTFQEGTTDRVYSKSVMYPSGTAGNGRNPFDLDERLLNYNKMRNNMTNSAAITEYGMKYAHAKSLDVGMNWGNNDAYVNSGLENKMHNRNKLLYEELMGESNNSQEDRKSAKDFELTNYFDSLNNGNNEINNGMTLDEMKEAMNGDNKNKNSSAKFTLIVNVPPNTTRKDLTAVFSKFGNVDLTMVVCDKQSRHPNKEWTATCGYAFVRFSTNLEAQRTLNATCSGLVRIRGSRVRATWAKKDSYSKREKEITFKIPSSILIINVEEFICAICKINLSYNPRLFPCCYASCCSDCLRNYIMNEKNQGNIKCPNCSLFIADRIIKIDRTSKGVMALLYKFHCNIKVRCPNEQCKWIGAQYQYLSHMFSCKYGLGQS